MSSPPQLTVIIRELQRSSLMMDTLKQKKEEAEGKNMHLKKAQSFPISRWDCLQPFHN